MELYDEVVQGLECCEKDVKLCYGETVCEYYRLSPRCWTTLAHDALALIRQQQARIAELEAAQTARLMTLEEVHEMSWDYCYLEEEVIKDKVLQMYCGAYLKCITWPSIAGCVLTFGDGAYGKRWRCWTQRPTDEQRKAAKWE